jgi:hypothetical protein
MLNVHDTPWTPFDQGVCQLLSFEEFVICYTRYGVFYDLRSHLLELQILVKVR